jgi:hypothetical protein
MALIIDSSPEREAAQRACVTDAESWRTDRVNILCYGPYDGGKTHFAAGFPKPVLVDVGENGALTVKKMIAKGELSENFPIVQTKDVSLVMDIAKDARAALGELFRETPWEGYEGQMESVIFDTISTFEGFVWEDVLKRAGKTDEESGIQQLEARARRMSTFFRAAWNLPYNVVMLSHEDPGREETRDGRGKVIMKKKDPGPLLTGKIARQCPALVDIMLFLRKEPTVGGHEVVGYTSEVDGWPTKVRLRGFLEDRIVNPSYAVLREALDKVEQYFEEKKENE